MCFCKTPFKLEKETFLLEIPVISVDFSELQILLRCMCTEQKGEEDRAWINSTLGEHHDESSWCAGRNPGFALMGNYHDTQQLSSCVWIQDFGG